MNKSKYLLIPLLAVTVGLFFYPSLVTFFVQDDFFLLSISQAQKVGDLVKFFVPLQEVVWYRPLSSQIFFLLGKVLFGLNPLPYHLSVITVHTMTGLSLFKLVELLSKNRQLAILSAFFYLFHQIHVVALSWLAAFSFVIGPFCLIWTLNYFLSQKYIKSYLIYVLGVLSSEIMIITIPIIIFIQIYELRTKKYYQTFIHLMPYIGITLLFLWLRLVVYPTQQTSGIYAISYQQLVPLFQFYLLRTLGVPMAIITMPTKFKITVIFLLTISGVVLIWGIFKIWRKKGRHGKLFTIIALFNLLPFLFLPNHLAPHYLSFALVGSAPLFALATIHYTKNKFTAVILLGSYLALQLIGSRWTYQTHWIFRRATLAKKLIETKQLVHPVASEEYYALGAGSAEIVYK